MKVIGDFNKISPKLKKEIPKLKQGQVVTFQMLNGVTNPEPDPTERSKTPMLYGKAQISTRDRIFDPYLNETGDYVDIGVVKNFSKNRDGDYEIETRLFVPGMGEFQFGGKFSLMGGRIEDEELFEFLWLCNENEKNPYRDKSVKPLFKPVNLLEDSKETINTTSRLREAVNLAGDMDVETAREIAASLNWSNIAEPEVLMAKINDFAAKFPDQFLKTAKSPKRETKATIKKALDNGVINFDVLTKKVTLGSELIATLSFRDGDDFLNAFTDWLNTSIHGADVLGNIKNQLEIQKQENSFIDKKKGKAKEVAV